MSEVTQALGEVCSRRSAGEAIHASLVSRVVLDSFFRADSTLTHMKIQVTQLRFNSNSKLANLTQLRLNSKPNFTNLTQL